MRAAAPSDWPPAPHRGDGPLPQLTGHDQLGVALWCADEIAGRVPPSDRAAFDEAVEMARRWYDGKPIRGKRLLRDVTDDLKKRQPRSLALEVARNVAAAGRSLAHGGSTISSVGKFAGIAAEAAVQLIGGGPRKPQAAVRRFLDDLDNEILCRELVGFLDERGTPPDHEPTRVLFRPAANGRTPALVVALLSRRKYGLWVKADGRWQWIEGSRKQVIEAIPERHAAAFGFLGAA